MEELLLATVWVQLGISMGLLIGLFLTKDDFAAAVEAKREREKRKKDD